MTPAPATHRDLIQLGSLDHHPPRLRRPIQRTDALEDLNTQLRNVTKKPDAFPTPGSVTNVTFLGLQRASRTCTRRLHQWPTALNHLALVFPGRVPRLGRGLGSNFRPLRCLIRVLLPGSHCSQTAHAEWGARWPRSRRGAPPHPPVRWG
jgi:hypothetical protein